MSQYKKPKIASDSQTGKAFKVEQTGNTQALTIPDITHLYHVAREYITGTIKSPEKYAICLALIVHEQKRLRTAQPQYQYDLKYINELVAHFAHDPSMYQTVFDVQKEMTRQQPEPEVKTAPVVRIQSEATLPKSTSTAALPSSVSQSPRQTPMPGEMKMIDGAPAHGASPKQPPKVAVISLRESTSPAPTNKFIFDHDPAAVHTPTPPALSQRTAISLLSGTRSDPAPVPARQQHSEFIPLSQITTDKRSPSSSLSPHSAASVTPRATPKPPPADIASQTKQPLSSSSASSSSSSSILASSSATSSNAQSPQVTQPRPPAPAALRDPELKEIYEEDKQKRHSNLLFVLALASMPSLIGPFLCYYLWKENKRNEQVEKIEMMPEEFELLAAYRTQIGMPPSAKNPRDTLTVQKVDPKQPGQKATYYMDKQAGARLQWLKNRRDHERSAKARCSALFFHQALPEIKQPVVLDDKSEEYAQQAKSMRESVTLVAQLRARMPRSGG